jgi:hypothetical protein
VRLIARPLTGGFELCARLGLVVAPPSNLVAKGWDGDLAAPRVFQHARVIHAVLSGSPCGRAGIEPTDIVLEIERQPWDSIRFLTFSERRPSEIQLKVFIARYFSVVTIAVRAEPEPYQPIDSIVAEAISAIAAKPDPVAVNYKNPRYDETIALLGQRGLLRRGRRR